jgi:hypothetical protein
MIKKGLSLLLIVGAYRFCGCKTIEVSSLWLDRPIVIDGSDAEWENAKMYIEEANLSLGLFDDAEYLYVSLVTADRNVQRRIMGQGLTVWFDAKSRKGKTFGIHFPLGMGGGMPGSPGFGAEGSGSEREVGRSSGFRTPGRGGAGAGENDAGYRPDEGMLNRVQTEMEILGPGKDDRVLLPLDGKQGIEVRTGYLNERLVYELKVPLIRGEEHPYAVGVISGKTFSIGFETPKNDKSRMPNLERMGGPPGGEGGEGGMGGGPPGGFGGPGGGRGMPGGGPGGPPPGGSGFSMPEPLKLWMNVVPAVKPSVEK